MTHGIYFEHPAGDRQWLTANSGAGAIWTTYLHRAKRFPSREAAEAAFHASPFHGGKWADVPMGVAPLPANGRG